MAGHGWGLLVAGSILASSGLATPAAAQGLEKGGREGLIGVEMQDYEFPLADVGAAIRQLEDGRRRRGLGG